jgi:uncharacterized membrane protein YfcA
MKNLQVEPVTYLINNNFSILIFINQNIFCNIIYPVASLKQSNISVKNICICGLGSSVGIATGYGLDGPGIESQQQWN